MTLFVSMLTTIIFFSFTRKELFSRISYNITFTGTEVCLIDLYFPWVFLLALPEDIKDKTFAFSQVVVNLGWPQGVY